jgi:hypothetical protein
MNSDTSSKTHHQRSEQMNQLIAQIEIETLEADEQAVVLALGAEELSFIAGGEVVVNSL